MRSTKETGDLNESIAAAHLVRLGYQILRRNYRVQGGELDIVARDGAVLCFVEVRSRATRAFGGPEETISRTKRRRIAHAARAFLAGERGAGRAGCRFDVVAICGAEISVLKDAFRLEDC